MLLTRFLTDSKQLERAVLALHVFLLCHLIPILVNDSLLPTVSETSKVGLIAPATHVESALVHGKLQMLLKVKIVRIVNSTIGIDALLFCSLKSHLLDLALELVMGIV